MTSTSSTLTVTSGVIEHIDPNQIIVESNVRTRIPLTREFVASIRENGVLTPILARRNSTGQVIVRAGQRRTLAARQAALATIPAYIVDADDTNADRIVQQMVENDHREALTDAERATAFQQLAFEGLTPAVIAKRTGTKTGRVTSSLAVASNPVAAAAIQTHQLTLDQAAALIEFEADGDVVAELIETATSDPAQFDHTAQRARDDRARAQILAKATADLIGRGFTVLEREPGYYETEHTRIRDLRTKDGDRVTAEHIEECVGRAAHVRVYNTGETSVTYFVADPKALGFKKTGTENSNAGPMTDEQKADRRELIANNKAWDSAEIVRRDWLATLLTRKTLPTNAAAVIALGLTGNRSAVSDAMGRGNTLAHQLLSIEPEHGYRAADRIAAYATKHPTKALHVALAVVLAGIEESTNRTTWRHPDTRAAAYLSLLADWGYTLSPVEQIVTNHTPTT